MSHTANCCPEIPEGKQCDYLDFIYRLKQPTQVDVTNGNQTVLVETAIHLRLERCTKGFQRGNLVYSTTLLPGEQVRLFSADRRSRFSFDSESQLAYRHEQSAEEQYYMEQFDGFMQSVESREATSADSSVSSSTSGSAGTNSILGAIFNGPSVSMSGSFNGSSTMDFVRELSSHVEASHNRSIQMTRQANSVQMGEVQSRYHAEGESESHYESSSRRFQNQNRCHAVTYLFYQIDKVQVVRLTVQAVTTRVIDPAGRSDVTARPLLSDQKLSIVPAGIKATDLAEPKTNLTIQTNQTFSNRVGLVSHTNPIYAAAPPMNEKVHTAALQQALADLQRAGVLTKEGKPTNEVIRTLEFEFQTTIPTAGIQVKGCLDDCGTCESAREKEIELELKRMELKNRLLERKIDLLDKAQEYRCCPEASDCSETEQLDNS